MIPTWGQQRGGATLSLDFINNDNVLDSRITFSRGSTATYYNSVGTLVSAAINAPRFDYNPSTLAARGLLIEESRANIAIYSDDFSNAAWNKANSSITSNTVAAPDGTLTGDKIVEDTATSAHSVSATIAATNQSYTFSIFAKKAERKYIQLFGRRDASNYNGVSVDLDTGAISAPTRATTTNNASTTTVTNVGNGWWRIAMTYTYTTTGNTVIFVAMGDATNTYSYTGNGTAGLYIWGAQLEGGAFSTSYIPTVAATVTRSADIATMTGTNFSSWYNQSQGTFITQFVLEGVKSVAGQRTIAADDGTNTNQILQSGSSTNTFQTTVTTGGAAQVSQTVPTITLTGNTVYKAALAYATNNTNGAVNAVLATNDTSCTMPTALTTFRFSTSGTSPTTVTANLWYASLNYYPTRLADSTLQALTT
jgi:hypothetical protein